jgi:hypothetical protein
MLADNVIHRVCDLSWLISLRSDKRFGRRMNTRGPMLKQLPQAHGCREVREWWLARWLVFFWRGFQKSRPRLVLAGSIIRDWQLSFRIATDEIVIVNTLPCIRQLTSFPITNSKYAWCRESPLAFGFLMSCRLTLWNSWAFFIACVKSSSFKSKGISEPCKALEMRKLENKVPWGMVLLVWIKNEHKVANRMGHVSTCSIHLHPNLHSASLCFPLDDLQWIRTEYQRQGAAHSLECLRQL